jgi:hypothetical protein
MPAEYGKTLMPQHHNPAWLPDDVIMRELKRIRYSDRHERQARRAPSLNDVANRSQIGIRNLYHLLCGEQFLTDRSRERLSIALRVEPGG